MTEAKANMLVKRVYEMKVLIVSIVSEAETKYKWKGMGKKGLHFISSSRFITIN